jgi:hypothetical protein
VDAGYLSIREIAVLRDTIKGTPVPIESNVLYTGHIKMLDPGSGDELVSQ